MQTNLSTGIVYLVGAGPGDPGLLTLRGRDVLARADVVVYDSLVNEALLSHAAGAEAIAAGKRSGQHSLTQDDIVRVLVDNARAGKTVVRLKGGDPFVFGRGGEECAALREAGIPFEVVPGVTAGLGVPAYAGIPVTHRGRSSSVTLLTGHIDSSQGVRETVEARLRDGTLVLFMSVNNLGDLATALVDQGRSADTPVAAVEWGTYPRQRTVTGTLADIHERCAKAGIEAPVITVVGEVVNLRETVSWFEARPLYGRRVAVTRARRRSSELVSRLRELGADVFEFPTVEIHSTEEEAAFPHVNEFDWVVLTSINGVDALFEGMKQRGDDVRALHGVNLCAFGARTAEGLAERGLNVDARPEAYEPEPAMALLESIGGRLDGQRVLLPRADIARQDLPQALRHRGAEVTELAAFRAEPPKETEHHVRDLVAFSPDYVIFNSASAARNFGRILGPRRIAELNTHATAAAIGPIAAEAAKNAGLPVPIVPDVHRVPELIEALVAWDTQRPH